MAAHAAWNLVAEENRIQLNAAISSKVSQFDEKTIMKREEVQKIIDDLTEDFVVVFWDTIEEIYHSVNYYERQGLVWKALYQKNQFLEGVKEIRDELIQILIECRAELVAQLNMERANFTITV